MVGLLGEAGGEATTGKGCLSPFDQYLQLYHQFQPNYSIIRPLLLLKQAFIVLSCCLCSCSVIKKKGWWVFLISSTSECWVAASVASRCFDPPQRNQLYTLISGLIWNNYLVLKIWMEILHDDNNFGSISVTLLRRRFIMDYSRFIYLVLNYLWNEVIVL